MNFPAPALPPGALADQARALRQSLMDARLAHLNPTDVVALRRLLAQLHQLQLDPNAEHRV